MLLFGLLNTPFVQEKVKNIIVKELQAKIGTDLGIGRLHFKPFNEVELTDVYLYGQENEKILLADRLSAGVDLISLMHGELVFTSARLADFEVYLSKDSASAPLNIQYVIDAFKSKDDKPKSQMNVVLNSVTISNGTVHYDVKDKPEKEDLFDPNHIHVSDFNAKLALKSILSDSLNIQVKKISLKEKSGLEVRDLMFRLISQQKRYSLRDFRLEMPSSLLELSRCELDLTPTSDTAKLIDYAQADVAIGMSHIAPKDVAAFSPLFRNSENTISLQAHFRGNINDFSVSDLILSQGDDFRLTANAEVKDLRNKEEMYLIGSIDELTVDSKKIEPILNNFLPKKQNLPDQISRLGIVSFAGDVSGYLKELTAFGSLETALGIVKMDVLFGFNPHRGTDSYVRGNVLASNFSLGKLLNNNNLDKVSLKLQVEAQKPTYGKMKGHAKGTISDFYFKGYTYKDILLDADYDGLRMDGKLSVDDPSGQLWLSGLFDFNDKENPELNFKARARNLQLDKVHLAEKMPYSYLSFSVDADFRGKNVDEAEGYVRIDSIDFLREDKVLYMDKLLVEVSNQEDSRDIKISSDIINGHIKGSYSLQSLFASIQETLHPYLPALIKENKRKIKEEQVNTMEFDFKINNTETISDIFKLPVTLYSQAKIFGHYNNRQNSFDLNLFAPSMKAAGMNIRSGFVKANTQGDKINADINLMILGKKEVTNDITIKSEIKNNAINTNISLLNNGMQQARGNFSVTTLFSRQENEPLAIDIDMLPSKLLLNNVNWAMDKSHIHIENGIIAIDDFWAYTDDHSQGIMIDGKYSQRPVNDDILTAELKKIDLSYIFQTLAIDALQFGGLASGELYVSTIEGKPYANTRLEVEDFQFNNTDLGNLNLYSEFNDETRLVKMDGNILTKENKLTKVDGSLDPVKQQLSIYFDADSIDIGFLNKYAESIFQGIAGRGTGKVHLHGNFSDVTVEGKAFIQEGSMGIKFLNTRYNFTDTVFLKNDLIYFNDLVLKDELGNVAHASGKVTHDYFHDFMYQVDLRATNFLLYNTTPSQNPLFYGKVFGSGNGSISGDESQVDLNIRMRTENNTVVRMNFMEDVISEYSFINYKDKSAIDTVTTQKAAQPLIARTESGMEINMNFYIDATPDAVVELVMDPVGGDVLRGSGSGAMQFKWNMKSSPELYGTYNIVRGGYNFTFQRLMERRFSILENSNVQFRGDPFQAILDVTATYKVNASLNDLDKNLAETTGQTTIPVNCVLKLTGELRHPNVGLDISFPTTDAEVERQIKSLINTEDEINKQVASLLILSKFRPPQGANVENPTSDFAAIASATLSNQLTKLVSQIDNRWQLGTNIRYNDRELTYTEAELLLSSQLLNDRLLINGNFGYRNDLNRQKEAMVTDVDIEYLLNNAGTWRIKAYNHYNEKFYYTQKESSPYTQGVGIIYKKDFDDLYELFHRRRPRTVIPRNEAIPIVPDSTMKGSPLSHFIKLKNDTVQNNP